MVKPEISVIIVSFNTKEALEECLWSVFENTNGINLEVIVIDNNSSDSSARMVKNQFPQVVLLKNKTNLGFAKAVNQGLKTGEANHFLLLNPDTIIKNQAIKTLLQFAKNQNNLGAIGAKLLNLDGTLQPSCYNLPSIKNAILEFWFSKNGAYEKFLPTTNEPIEIETIVGAVMLIPRKAIEKVGFFDERYFMYFEDLDWCRRAKSKGLKIYWHPKAEVVHLHGAAAGQNTILSQKRLIESSKIYNGWPTYTILTAIIKLGRKFRHY